MFENCLIHFKIRSQLIFINIFFILACNNNKKFNNVIDSKFLKDEKGNCPSSIDSIIKLAELEFIKKYGNDVLDKKPFTAKLEDDSVWLISGTPKYEESKVFPDVNSVIGGVPYMRIIKSDCKVIQISYSK